ncbi:hypothetical protein EC844_12541 [Acinetobacter calcoaceticus]|uniref:DUF6651 domain-containing protein n=1 Tax=Acinetobacter calcoaceticus TaxID=471 RepID=A0A4R1XRL4_ACICA|nr:hypothetical protein EC844_12541 [Acinetobacter calcoaceticus]
MKIKTVTVDGKQYAELNDAGLPLYIHDDGKEVGFDAGSALQKISSLNAEARTHREAKEKAESALKGFEGIEDPAAAIKAMQTVKNFSDKNMVEAGEVEKIRAEAIKAVEDKYAPVVQERDGLQSQLHGELIGGGFARSKYVSEKLNAPVDMVQAMFGGRFKVEGGKRIGHDASGQPIFSRSRPGELADFDEALECMVDSYQHKDQIIKGSQANGGGFNGNTAANNSGLKRSEMSADSKAEYLKAHGQDSYLKLPK